MLKKKKSSTGFLYAGLKNKINPITETKNENKPQIKRKLVVAVTSLKHGVGCSYTSVAIANYLSEVSREKVCLLHKGCSYVDSILDGRVDSIFYPCNMSEVYSNYGYIVYDGGVVNEIDKNMLDRSDIKIMMCWLNEEYKRLLADFIRSRNDLNNWIFLFNSVPEKQNNEVYRLMEEYSACCLPIFDVSIKDKQMKGLFDNIFLDR
jgi:hypothetical protein